MVKEFIRISRISKKYFEETSIEVKLSSLPLHSKSRASYKGRFKNFETTAILRNLNDAGQNEYGGKIERLYAIRTTPSILLYLKMLKTIKLKKKQNMKKSRRYTYGDFIDDLTSPASNNGVFDDESLESFEKNVQDLIKKKSRKKLTFSSFLENQTKVVSEDEIIDPDELLEVFQRNSQSLIN